MKIGKKSEIGHNKYGRIKSTPSPSAHIPIISLTLNALNRIKRSGYSISLQYFYIYFKSKFFIENIFYT